MDSALLKSIMALNNDTGTKLADYLGISKSALSQKMNGKFDFTRTEISQIKSKYSLTNDQVNEIFFAK